MQESCKEEMETALRCVINCTQSKMRFVPGVLFRRQRVLEKARKAYTEVRKRYVEARVNVEALQQLLDGKSKSVRENAAVAVLLL